MAQPANDNQKNGVVSSYPDNVHQGVYTGGDNYTPISMATSEDGDEADRGQSPDAGTWGRWLPGMPAGIE